MSVVMLASYLHLFFFRWTLSFRVSNQNPVCIPALLFPHSVTTTTTTTTTTTNNNNNNNNNRNNPTTITNNNNNSITTNTTTTNATNITTNNNNNIVLDSCTKLIPTRILPAVFSTDQKGKPHPNVWYI